MDVMVMIAEVVATGVAVIVEMEATDVAEEIAEVVVTGAVVGIDVETEDNLQLQIEKRGLEICSPIPF